MDINDRHSPTSVPSNELTQMIEAVAARNRGGVVSLPPERGSVISADSQPTVRSAELGTVVRQAPLSAEESALLDRMALESGLVRGPVTPGIRNMLNNAAEEGPYGSLEDAIRAGAPVGMSDEEIAAQAVRFREPEPVRRAIGERGPVQTPRQFIAAQPASQLPRLPDFKQVQIIDLINGKVYVDGLEFVLTKEQSQMLRRFAVQTAKEQIQKSLDTALAALDAEGSDGSNG
jgi:hypothetical protein